MSLGAGLRVSKHYRLDENNNPVECDRPTWESNIESLNRIVKTTKIGRYTISTAFVGIDFPFLFETAIIDDWCKEETKIQSKCETWGQAEMLHKIAVEYVGSELVPF